MHRRIAELAVGLLAAALVACAAPGSSHDHATGRRPMDDRRIREVASHFLCPCKGCERMELVDCNCEMPDGGLVVKLFISELLEQGRGVEDVVARVAARFGSRKYR